MFRSCSLIAAALLAAGCVDRDIAGVAAHQLSGESSAESGWDGPGVTVMTYNVYYGTDPTPLLTAPLDQVPFIAAGVWATVQQTNFPARAGALATLIASRRPHLVGLEEAAVYRLQHPGDAAFGGSVPATDVVYDFLALLVDSLDARGVHYVVAAADSTTDIELPAFTGLDASGNPSFDDVRLTDRDAVLARADVEIDNPQHGKYQAYIPVSFGPVQTGVFEGWSSVDATVGGRTVRFVATHLEAQLAVPVQMAQAQELLALLQSETRPTILAGDFNSDVLGQVPGAATPSYGMITGAGFADSWLQPHQPDPGPTCCETVDLLNPLPTLNQRIDFIFTRHLAPLAIPLAREVVGNDPANRTPGGLWPSDHAGVVTALVLPPARPQDVTAQTR
jgi:endonuclease/exonuclease/phosphatase family protein